MLGDESVGTRQLEDLAVTIGKQSDPLSIVAGTTKKWSNEPLTTSLTEITTVDIAVPSWAGNAFIYATARFQISNSSGGNQNCYCILDLNDVVSNDSSTSEITVANNETGVVPMFLGFGLTSPGSTVTVRVRAKVSTGTNSSNNTNVAVLALVTR